MKAINLVLSIILVFGLASCVKQGVSPGSNQGNEREVEISISTSAEGRNTRAQVFSTDPGASAERFVGELDLLVFGSDGKYLYRREASKLTSGLDSYRALLAETTDVLTVHLLANCRTILRQWEQEDDRTGLTWEQVHGQLVDLQPRRLVNSAAFQPLPMWGTVTGSLAADKAPTKWQNVQLLRSVASIDLYVQQNTPRTEDFILTDVYACYVPDKGYIGAREVTPAANPKQYMIPSGMTTPLNDQFHATRVTDTLMSSRNYKAIAYQVYLYDNAYTNTANSNARPTRIVMAGYYKQTGPEAGWQKSYYPIDMVDALGYYMPVVRNWKYEYKVFAVNGPGCGSLGEAAQSANTDLAVEITDWNTAGVKGEYYLNMERKSAILWRPQSSKDELLLTYQILDNDLTDRFTIRFRNAGNGTQTDIADGISNDYFSVVMTRTGTDQGSVKFVITALQDYTAGHEKEYLEVKFRDISYEITITQVDCSEQDWEDGGNIGKILQ